MIPVFPDFKKLQVSDKDSVNVFLLGYPPYSDYNFAGLWSYDTQDKVEISLLNDNLVLKSCDYVTTEPFLSFFGSNLLQETIAKLFECTKGEGFNQTLKLISDFIIAEDSIRDHFLVEEDTDNFDYILSCQELSELSGKKYGPKRNFINRFNTSFPNHEVKDIDIKESTVQSQIINLFLEWERLKDKKKEETEIEFLATKRFMDAAEYFKISSIGVYVDQKLIAYSLDEVVQQNYGVIHFEKAIQEYVGVYQFLKQQTAISLNNQGCKYINYEQDLGILGLRKAKLSWNPVFVLKKYKISPKFL